VESRHSGPRRVAPLDRALPRLQRAEDVAPRADRHGDLRPARPRLRSRRRPELLLRNRPPPAGRHRRGSGHERAHHRALPALPAGRGRDVVSLVHLLLRRGPSRRVPVPRSPHDGVPRLAAAPDRVQRAHEGVGRLARARSRRGATARSGGRAHLAARGTGTPLRPHRARPAPRSLVRARVDPAARSGRLERRDPRRDRARARRRRHHARDDLSRLPAPDLRLRGRGDADRALPDGLRESDGHRVRGPVQEVPTVAGPPSVSSPTRLPVRSPMASTRSGREPWWTRRSAPARRRRPATCRRSAPR